MSSLFYTPKEGFIFAHNPALLFLEGVAYYGSRALGLTLGIVMVATLARRKAWGGLDTKAWAFLLLALLLGPGLIANLIFKDHWGRARPREVVEFGGMASFSPALIMQPTVHKNSSFVSGDASFGFFLPAFAYVVPRRLSRRTFWAAIGAGSCFGFARLLLGAHFLSDILYAAAFVLSATAMLHAVMYGGKTTQSLWREWFTPKA